MQSSSGFDASIVLRPWSANDSVTELTQLLHRAYAALAAEGMHFVASWQYDATTERRIASGRAWVAVAGERIVGTVLFRPPGTRSRCPYYVRPGVATFHQFAVDPPFQGRGIAGRLLRKAEALAVEAGAVELALDTAAPATRLIAMYRRHGFEIVDRMQWPDVNYASVVMSKRVRPEA